MERFMDFRLKTHHSEHYDRYKMLYCRGSNVSFQKRNLTLQPSLQKSTKLKGLLIKNRIE